MLSLFSTLGGLLISGLPKLLDFFQNKADQKHELALARVQVELQLQMMAQGFAAQERIEEIRTGTVRPTVTYIFVFELCAINAWIAYYIYSRPSLINNIDDLIRLSDIIFSTDEMAMLGGIIGFWFGSRGWSKK